MIALRRGISISVPKARRDLIDRIPLTLEFKTRRQLRSGDIDPGAKGA
jgi:hypothetical protein